MATEASSRRPNGPGRCLKFWRRLALNKLQGFSLLSVVLGIGLGALLKTFVPSDELDDLYFGFPGELLLQLLELFTVPLIVTSVITACGRLRSAVARNLAIRTGIYIISTTLMAVVVGMILVLVINPGWDHAVQFGDEDKEFFSTALVLRDFLTKYELTFNVTFFSTHRNMFPESAILACFQQYKTVVVEVPGEDDENESAFRLVDTRVSGANIVGLVFWSFIFGIYLANKAEEGQVILESLEEVNKSFKVLFSWIMWYLPLGVLFLVANHIIQVNDWEIIFKLEKFAGVVALGSATLPITLQCCENKLGCDSRISRFVLPIATSLNMNGTALYEVVAVVFIAQLNGITLDFSQIFCICVTATIASLGAAGIPATGALTTLFVLTAVGLPAKDASLLVVLEWILDRLNTVINVLGDCFGVALIQDLSLRELDDQGPELTRISECKQELDPGEILDHTSSQDSSWGELHTPPEN
ncbi:excitatory amino acid transporter 3-like [Xenentodon cancila]